MAVRNRKLRLAYCITGRGAVSTPASTYQAALHAVGLVCRRAEGELLGQRRGWSFFAPLKQELCHRLPRFASRDEARRAIFEYIEIFTTRRLTRCPQKRSRFTTQVGKDVDGKLQFAVHARG